jgi:hypothetical protein
MKIEQINKSLEENIKFTNKEIMLVKREAKNFKVGIEYEYHVDTKKVSKYTDDVDFDLESDIEEVWMDSLYDYSEYQDALIAAENEMINAAMVDAKSEFIITTQDGIHDEILTNEFIDFLNDLIDRIKTYNTENLFKWYSNWDMFKENIDLMIQMGVSGVSESTRRDVFGKMGDLLKMQQTIDTLDFSVLSDISSTGMPDYIDPLFSRFIMYDAETLYDAWDELKRTKIPIFAGFEESSPQRAFEFNTYIQEMETFLEEDFIDSYEYFESFISGMGTDALVGIVINPRKIIEDIETKVSKHVENMWKDDERDVRLESIQEDIRDSGDAMSGIDSHSMMAEIERNHNVRFVDDEGEHYFNDGGERKAPLTTIISNILDQWDIDDNDIEKVTLDPSVIEGVETITKALPLDDALDMMKKMFKHISDVGHTSEKTGMHVNMSFRGYDFKRDNFNPTKLVMLADPKMMNEFFPVRTHVGKMFMDIGVGVIMDLATSDNISREFSNNVMLNKKNQGINFSHISHFIESQRRIEFRYFGGDGYETRYNTMEWNIYRFVYLMMAAFSEGFADNEYQKAIVKYLDGQIKTNILFKDAKISSFVELRTVMNRNNLYTYNELKNYMDTQK